MNKALQKLLRYDLDDKTEVGLVTYSHTSKIEFNMTQLAGVRQHLADILPDKYRLDRSRSESCLLCGVTNALEILGQHKQEGNIIILTRGDPVSEKEQSKLMEYVGYYQVAISS